MNGVLKEALNLLYWTMLAATTVGPGTVVSCARAGAEYQMHLIWALIFGSILAYILQEGTARLTIVSGKSLGECLQLKYSSGRKVWNVGILCWIVVISVFIGNTLYECNCFAGGLAAVYALPPVEQTVAIRWIACVTYGLVVFGILYAGKVDALGVGLGIVTVSMVTLFFVVVCKLGVDGVRFAKGLIPISLPQGSINIVLSLIGTTSLGFNLFLGGEMAKGQKLPSAQRGIAFSTVMAFLISVLILIVGDGTHGDKNKGAFTIESLVEIIQRLTGETGTWVFGLGFIAAALSSMLTVPLGAALTADSILTINKETDGEGHMATGSQTSANGDHLNNEAFGNGAAEAVIHQTFPKKYYLGMMLVMIIISALVIGANSDRVLIILVAQVFNGCLLPFFATCLLLCINEAQFMSKSPQKGWSNCCLIIVVWISMFLTCNTVIQNIFGWTVVKGYATITIFQRWSFIISGITSLTVMLLLFFLTNLWRNVKNSFYLTPVSKISPHEDL